MKKLFPLVRILLCDEPLPSAFQSPLVRRDDPRSARHDARAAIVEQRTERREIGPFAAGLRQKRRAPVAGTIDPVFRVERERRERRELLLPLARRQRAKAHARRIAGAFAELSRREHDADRLLHALEDPRRHVRLMALGRTVDHKNVRARPAQIVAHPLEPRPVEKAGDGDETDNAFLVRIFETSRGEAACAKDLQRRPAPEIDIEVLEVLSVRADAPVSRRLPSVEWRVGLPPAPFSIQPPRPCALSLYGGLPMTTVIG